MESISVCHFELAYIKEHKLYYKIEMYSVFVLKHDCRKVQSNPVNTDTEGAIKSQCSYQGG